MVQLYRKQYYWTSRKCICRLLLPVAIGSIIIITILYNKDLKFSNFDTGLLELTDDSIQANINKMKTDSDQELVRANDDSSSNTTPPIYICGDLRGLGQNVVAYCLYGNFSDPTVYARYIDPMKLAINHIQRFYPGWIIRIYYSSLNDAINNQRLQVLFPL